MKAGEVGQKRLALRSIYDWVPDLSTIITCGPVPSGSSNLANGSDVLIVWFKYSMKFSLLPFHQTFQRQNLYGENFNFEVGVEHVHLIW